MAPSPQDVIDLTETDDEHDNKEQERHLRGIKRNLDSSFKKRKRGSLKTTGLDDDDNDGHSVIVIDSSDEDDDDGGGKIAASSPKKVKMEDNGDKRKSQIKQEGQKSVSFKTSSIVDDGFEVVEDAGPQMVAAAASAPTSGDEDIVLEGVTNEVRLPHLRQDCTKYPFLSQQLGLYTSPDKNITSFCLAKNSQHCELCYCYVCDCPVKDCIKWHNHHGNNKIKNNHCCAHNDSTVWQRLRKDAKKTKSPSSAGLPSSNDASGDPDVAPAGFHFPLDCPDDDDDDYGECGECWCYVCDCPLFDECESPGLHMEAGPHSQTWRDMRAVRQLSTYGQPGPFPPANTDAAKEPGLIQCRHCSWYSRKRKPNSWEPNRKYTSDDWCRACGRVASESVLSSTNDVHNPTEEETKEWHLFGEKEIPFRVHAHDPRLFPEYKDKWTENPDWTFDEVSQEEEVFLHLLGTSPSLTMIHQKIAYCTEEKISKIGNNYIERDQTDAIVVDDPLHVRLIALLKHYSVSCYVHTSASWEKELRTGTITVRLWLPKYLFLGSNIGMQHYDFRRLFPSILLCWFGMSFEGTELSRQIEPSVENSIEHDLLYTCGSVDIPFGSGSIVLKTHIPAATQLADSKSDDYTAAAEKYSSNLYLSSSDPEGGGLSAFGTSFKSIIQRFLQEQLPVLLTSGSSDSARDLIRVCYGQTRSHRAESDRLVLESACGFSETVIARWLLRKPAAEKMLPDKMTTKQIMGCLENLGHDSVSYVEGLEVDLLPFQKQALKWALEREQTPGGIQSFYWAKLPRKENRGEDWYFNPILSQLRKDKPAIARGGILAAEMGLGKTIISLGLILKNPAPVLPISGSPITSLSTAPSPTSGEGWDKSLFAKTSDEHPKRGSIVSRGTLVICPVSLVGQWIEEAKSRLSNPGLVYPYHGQNRKRDAKKLAKAAIVVTTYQVLASDATYHKAKGGEGYCAPLEQVRWWRIIADEGHSLREGNTQRNHAVQALAADNKWIVTGTPMSTDPKEMKNLFTFLGIEESTKMFGLCTGSVKSRHRRRSRRDHDDTDDNYSVAPVKANLLMFLLRPILLRYSQNQKYRGTGTTLMSLPTMKKRTLEISFSSSEKMEFDKLEKSAQDFYLSFRQKHLKDMSKHFLKVSAKLMPLRVASAGGKYPITASDTEASNDDEDDSSADEDDIEFPSAKSKKRAINQTQYSDFAFKSKTQALISELKKIRDNEPDSKSLIFSQFTSTLEYLQEQLPQHNFSFRTLKGSMSMQQRAKALHDFQNDPPTTVFLLSMRSGAVGINLTQANRVFLMEPGFNPALEAQAIGRVHRLGQKRNVEVCRLIMKDSFESRMVQFLKKKYKLSFDDDEKATAEENNNESHTDDKKPAPMNDPSPTAQGLVGNLQTERAQIVTEEFDELFGVQDRLNEAGSESATPGIDDDDDILPDGAISGCI